MKKIFTLIATALVAISANAQVQDVDLGTGVLWGDRYVGASDVKTVGGYYAFGDPTAKTDFTIDNYAYANESFVYKDDTYKLLYFNTATPDVKDVATEVAGSEWRTPTTAELQSLIDNCTFTLEEAATQSNPYAIIKITGKNNNSITLITTGYYNGKYLNASYYLALTSSTVSAIKTHEGCYCTEHLQVMTVKATDSVEGSIKTPSIVQDNDNLGVYGFCILPVKGDASGINEVNADGQVKKANKYLQNGKLVIENNGRTYNAAGALLK